MNPDLAAQISRFLAQQPDSARALVLYLHRQRAASARRRRQRALVSFGAHVVDEGSRAERLSALATGADRERLRDVAVDVVLVLEDSPSLSLRQLRKAVRNVRGRCADGDVDAAVVYLGRGVRRDPGPRSAWLHTVDFARLPGDVASAFGSERARQRAQNTAR